MIGALSTACDLLPCPDDKRHYLYVGDDGEFHLKVWVEEKDGWAEVPMERGNDPILLIEEIAGKINHDRRRRILKVVNEDEEKAPDA